MTAPASSPNNTASRSCSPRRPTCSRCGCAQRVVDSYQMRPNPDIPRDGNIITFPINPRYTKQGMLDGKVGLEADPDYPNAADLQLGPSYFKPDRGLRAQGPIRRASGKNRYEEFNAVRPAQAGPDATGSSRVPAVQRDLANTYVWTAARRPVRREEQTLDTSRETTGGNYPFKRPHRPARSTSTSAGPVSDELSALFGGHLDCRGDQGADSDDSWASASRSPEARHHGPDQHGDQVTPAGKVDAYRYMTFYLSRGVQTTTCSSTRSSTRSGCSERHPAAPPCAGPADGQAPGVLARPAPGHLRQPSAGDDRHHQGSRPGDVRPGHRQQLRLIRLLQPFVMGHTASSSRRLSPSRSSAPSAPTCPSCTTTSSRSPTAFQPTSARSTRRRWLEAP